MTSSIFVNLSLASLCPAYTRPHETPHAPPCPASHVCPHSRRIERIKRAATKVAQSLTDLTYMHRLKKLNLETLEERRVRRDLVWVY